MITDHVVGWLLDLASWVIGLLPDSHIEIPDTAAAYVHMGDLGYFLPIPEVAAAVFAAYALGPALLATTLITWLLVGVVRGGNPKM